MVVSHLAITAISAAFLGSLVEAVEALTIVLAVASVRGWRAAGIGALAGFGLLSLILIALGPLLGPGPIPALQPVDRGLPPPFRLPWPRTGHPAAARQGAREHAQVRRRRHALGLRCVLDRRRPRGCLAWRRSRDRRHRRAFPHGRRARRCRAQNSCAGAAMRLLAGIARELVGLFIDDGMFALAIIAVVVTAAMVASLTPGITAGVVLVAGLPFALFANVMAAQR